MPAERARKATPAKKSGTRRPAVATTAEQGERVKSTARKATVAKKAPAARKRTTQREPKRARQRRVARPGPTPILLNGFVRDAVGTDTAPWGTKAPATVVLAALRAGATWELAARVAKLHPATPREWNSRGAQVLGELPAEGAELAANTPDETVAYLAFHLEAEAARVGTVVSALITIDRAARSTTDARLAVQASEIILRRHPEAKPYRPDPRLELTGPEGGPIPVSVREEAQAKLERMAQRLADNDRGDDEPAKADG